MSVGTKPLYIVTWLFYLFLMSAKHYWRHCWLKYRESCLFQKQLSISKTLPEGYVLFITIFLEFCCSLTTVFWQQTTLGTCIPTSLFAPVLLSVYSHLFVCSSAYVTTYWFGVVHWDKRKKKSDFYFCSVKPTMKQCCHTKRNFKVPDAEVLPFKTKTHIMVIYYCIHHFLRSLTVTCKFS